MPDLAGARIGFAGTPAFAVPSLAMLLAAGASVPVVLTQPDRPAGRGRKLTASPVKQLALEHGLRVEQPEQLREPALLAPGGTDGTSGGQPTLDALLVVAYGLLLPRWLLEMPRVGCVNVHASLLPRWRGAAPIQRAILAGDAQTGISIMRMELGLDTGPVYARAATPIGPDETAGSLHDRLAELGAALAGETLPAILAGRSVAVDQDAGGACHAAKLTKSEAILDWREPAALLARRVRAYNPWPVAEGKLDDGRRIRIWRAVAAPGPTPDSAGPGAIVAAGPDGIDVASGDGVLRLVEVQSPGSRRVDVADWLRSQTLDGATFVPA